MVFSDTTGFTGIIQSIERHINEVATYISGDATRLKHFTARVNIANSRIWHWIWKASEPWQYNDVSSTQDPFASQTLSNSTSTYTLPTNTLAVNRVEIADVNGIWRIVPPITQQNVLQASAEVDRTDGPPIAYRLYGNSLELIPAPNYGYADGLKIFFDKGAATFATTDTTKTPGFASEYHELLPIEVSIDYLSDRLPAATNLPLLIQERNELRNNLREFYAKRFKDYRSQIGRAYQSFR